MGQRPRSEGRFLTLGFSSATAPLLRHRPRLSFTATFNSCSEPRYRSVVCMELWQQRLDLLKVASALATKLIGWSAASTPLHLGYKRCTEEVPMQIHTLGVDLGKTILHLVGLNLQGEVVVRKKCSRIQLLQFTANMQVALIGMEACAGAHFL